MTINELKAIIKLGRGDRIVVLNDNEEIVEYNGSEIVKALRGAGDWDGYVYYNVYI